jgi:hypothetical protein
MTFNGLSAVISQKTELFITTAVRTSNPDLFVPYAQQDGCINPYTFLGQCSPFY